MRPGVLYWSPQQRAIWHWGAAAYAFIWLILMASAKSGFNSVAGWVGLGVTAVIVALGERSVIRAGLRVSENGFTARAVGRSVACTWDEVLDVRVVRIQAYDAVVVDLAGGRRRTLPGVRRSMRAQGQRVEDFAAELRECAAAATIVRAD